MGLEVADDGVIAAPSDVVTTMGGMGCRQGLGSAPSASSCSGKHC
jgi:hypothetical protein